LIFPRRWIAGAGFRLDVIPPHVLRALTVGPNILAGNRTRVTPDAFVEMKDH
jgi:hypothetical protein